MDDTCTKLAQRTLNTYWHKNVASCWVNFVYDVPDLVRVHNIFRMQRVCIICNQGSCFRRRIHWRHSFLVRALWFQQSCLRVNSFLLFTLRVRSPCTVFGDPITSDNQRWLPAVTTLCWCRKYFGIYCWNKLVRDKYYIEEYIIISSDQGGPRFVPGNVVFKANRHETGESRSRCNGTKSLFWETRRHNGMQTIKFLHI